MKVVLELDLPDVMAEDFDEVMAAKAKAVNIGREEDEPDGAYARRGMEEYFGRQTEHMYLDQKAMIARAEAQGKINKERDKKRKKGDGKKD